MCDDYYEGDGVACTDIDECQTENGGCGDPVFYTCTNVEGGPPVCDGQECGNGLLEGSEACDDGNLVDRDGCQADCSFTEAVDCNEADHIILLGDAHVRCVVPNVAACDTFKDFTPCTFMDCTDQLSGFCLENQANQNSECLAACDTTSGGNCDNPNSLCEASYILGAPETVGVCRPESFYQSAAECPGGGIPVDRGDGTFGCVAPQATTCTIEDFSDDGESNLQ